MFKHNYVHTQLTWRVSLVPGSKVDNHRPSAQWSGLTEGIREYTGFQSTQRTDMLVPASKKWGYETWRVGSQPQEVGPCWCWWTTNIGCEAMNWSNIGPVFCRKCPVIFRVLDTHICGGLHRHPQRLRDNSIDMDHYSHVHFTEKRGWANSPVTHRAYGRSVIWFSKSITVRSGCPDSRTHWYPPSPCHPVAKVWRV